jgi:hypothetical protein
MTTEILWVLVPLIAMVVLLTVGYLNDKRNWNGGMSPLGIKWEYFDMDSQGGRGYTDGNGNYVWISYGVDKNYRSQRIIDPNPVMPGRPK